MCIVCDRINMIKNGTNPYFVKELDTGYVVIGDNQHFYGYALLLYKISWTWMREPALCRRCLLLLKLQLTHLEPRR